LLLNSNCIEYLYMTDLFINVNIDMENKNRIIYIHNLFSPAILNRLFKLDSQKPKRFRKNVHFLLTKQPHTLCRQTKK